MRNLALLAALGACGSTSRPTTGAAPLPPPDAAAPVVAPEPAAPLPPLDAAGCDELFTIYLRFLSQDPEVAAMMPEVEAMRAETIETCARSEVPGEILACARTARRIERFEKCQTAGLEREAAKPGTRPPTAADLAAYTRAIPGTGPLVATIETSKGTLHCELAADKAPMTVANFVGLATGQHPWWDERAGKAVTGVPFYDGLTFHRVIPDFMIQGGDPEGTGRGGPGYVFADELHPDLTHESGALSMANATVDGNGSQFFVTAVATHHLDDLHAVFGYCEELDVIEAIAGVPRDSDDMPEVRVTIDRVTIGRR